jgi:branched-chain amino acid transport system permease protein
VGGTRTFWGPILRAFVYIILQNYLSDITDRWALIMGLIFVFMVLFVPGGLSGLILSLKSRLRPSRERMDQVHGEASR